MRQKVFAGHAVRRLREKFNLKQTELAARLQVSPSYINQIESNQRPLTAPVLIAISRAFGVDITTFGAEDLDRIVADLRESAADPMFRDLDLGLQDMKAVANLSPAFAHAFLRMHVALRRTAEWRASLDDMLTAGGDGADEAKLIPYEEVRDYFHYIDNYVDDLDRAAEALAERLGVLAGSDPAGVFAEHLSRVRGVRVEVGAADPGAPLSALDARTKRLVLSGALSPQARAFRLAATIAQLEQADLVEGQLAPLFGLHLIGYPLSSESMAAFGHAGEESVRPRFRAARMGLTDAREGSRPHSLSFSNISSFTFYLLYSAAWRRHEQICDLRPPLLAVKRRGTWVGARRWGSYLQFDVALMRERPARLANGKQL